MELLPESRLRNPKGSKRFMGLNWVPLYCANCGVEGGYVPEDSLSCNYSHYECLPCAEKLGELVGHYKVPDEVFWEKVKQAQLEEDGRELTEQEVIEALKDSTHYLTKLTTERESYLKASRT